MAIPCVVFTLALVLLPALTPQAVNHFRDLRPGCFGDARDQYFAEATPFQENPEDDEFGFAPDKCRLATAMEKEIQYLRNLMDKCDRCEYGTSSPITDGRKCADSPCASGASCTDTPTGGTVCGPCPVGYDGNGLSCSPRAGCF
uniref:Putative conserved secreted protein n=1 Tax=Culex tarsalis TaxID=7177 RepID=A0A1Q3FR29_CULTA